MFEKHFKSNLASFVNIEKPALNLDMVPQLLW